MATDIGPLYALLMVFISGAIALHFVQDHKTVYVFHRTSAMMHRLQQIEFAHGKKVAAGDYNRQGRLRRGDMERLQLARVRCDILFKELMAVDWLIPADGELMKELEGCEFEVTTASVVVKD